MVNPKACAAACGRLSERQVEVLRLLADGLQRKQVAARLGISEGTVNVHCEVIYSRLGVSGLVQAIRVATTGGVL